MYSAVVTAAATIILESEDDQIPRLVDGAASVLLPVGSTITRPCTSPPSRVVSGADSLAPAPNRRVILSRMRLYKWTTSRTNVVRESAVAVVPPREPRWKNIAAEASRDIYRASRFMWRMSDSREKPSTTP
eukprot:CAMPEP_0119120828 /NCGR_PEP_ID=MMETSP1310-20130426/1714_1 /TAXON_ID=464262 /ORGANISM="Genus nov. species nov., Strain RCC2339" /LENGTH=130 /DNA_ID=CAMNT_0007110335 /DNA_START=367 /DNA_END=759 /DNA_ORIENTATION=+